VSQSLSRWQAAVLGLLVLAALGFGAYGVARIADKQGLWADTVEVTAGFPETHDVTPGTPVRVRGVDAGQVVSVEYPDHDGPNAQVTVRMRLQARFASRLYADATAHIHANGLLGSKVISIQPGSPDKGALADNRLRGVRPFQVEEAVAEVRDLAREAKGTAAEVKQLATDARGTVATANTFIKGLDESNGTLAKLIRDDDLYTDARGTLADMRKVLGRADKAVGSLEGEVEGLRGFVSDGRDTLKSMKQGSDALKALPIVRNYVEDATALLVRPTMKREGYTFPARDLFEPGTATLTAEGKRRVDEVGGWLKTHKESGSEVVVVAYHDPKDAGTKPAVALELTKKQAQVVADQLTAGGATKLGTFSRRKIVPLGMGPELHPAEPDAKAGSNLQILLFVPR
jgi:phospholipid/cholesterol/gamma-HCH transport system substrate-binding protein